MEKLHKTFDVIVVGAGTGGSTAARFAAESGLSVCLIDSKDRKEIGNKICGDAVGSEIFDFLRLNTRKMMSFPAKSKALNYILPT